MKVHGRITQVGSLSGDTDVPDDQPSRQQAECPLAHVETGYGC